MGMDGKKFVNIEYAGRKGRVETTGMTELIELQKEIKDICGISQGAFFIDLFFNDTQVSTLQTIPEPCYEEVGPCLRVKMCNSNEEYTENFEMPALKKARMIEKINEGRESNRFFLELSNYLILDGCLFCSEQIPATIQNKIYIRDSFFEIGSRLLEKPKKTRLRAIITGTPGIGKSLFLFYFLWLLVQRNERVLFIYGEWVVYYHSTGAVFEMDRNLPDFRDYLFWNDDLWCLVDSRERTSINVPYNFCSVVLSTCPRRDFINDFKKGPPAPALFYMPLWEQAELEQLASTIYCNTADTWRKRYEILGGIPRYVFENVEISPEVLVSTACLECELDDCTKLIGLNSTITEKSKIVHTLVHINSISPYTCLSVQFASLFVLNTIVREKRIEARRKMQTLLESCSGNPLAASLCGHIFEDYAIEMLTAGGVFKCRQLFRANIKKKSEMDLVIPPSHHPEIADRIEESQTEGKLYVPKTRNYTAIDAWIPGIGGFQMTVSKNHDIKCGAADDLLKLGAGGNRLFFVLPPLYFDDFTKKPPQEINQYAMLIPYPTVAGS